MNVMKFGGASIVNEGAIVNVINIIEQFRKNADVLVFSATGKTTRHLLKAAHDAAAGEKEAALSAVESIYNSHNNLFLSLANNSQHMIFPKLAVQYKLELETLITGIFQVEDCSLSVLDHVLSYGELFSTALMTDTLASRGIPAARIDARELIVTDDCFSRARPLMDLTESNIKDKALPVIRSGKIPVIEGFIGRTLSGYTTTLGFEGSDFTAAILGAALEAETVQVWKDVPGVMSADPEICENPMLVNRLTYAEAGALTHFGAKILHPKTLEPAMKKNIPIQVKSINDPFSEGTCIYNYKTTSAEPELVSITYQKGILLIQLTVESSINPGHAIREIWDMICRFDINPYFLNVTQNRISLAVESGRWPASGNYELERIGKTAFYPEAAIIALVGENIQRNYSIAEKSCCILGGLSVFCTIQGLCPDAVLFALPEKDCKTALCRLHKHFFEEAVND